MAAQQAGQLDLFAIPDEEETADLIDDGDTLPIIRRVLPARGMPTPKILGPVSVFDLAHTPGRRLRIGGDNAKSRVAEKVDLGGGRTKVVGANYPPRWTEADFERERLRRARQRPPKPSRKAKTRSRKLLELIGDPNDDE